MVHLLHRLYGVDAPGESKMFIKDKTKVVCRMSGIERRVVYFRKLLFEIDNEI